MKTTIINILKLIDDSNENLEMGGSAKQRKAEQKLIELGIYNDEGEMISNDPKIVEYYESTWC